MGANAIAFIKALGLKQVDLFGFSIGGMVVQEITLQAPDLVRRLSSMRRSARRSGNGVDSPGYRAALWCPPPRSARECLARGQIQSVPRRPGGGTEYLERTHLRQEGRDPEVNDKVSPAQVEAIGKWGVQQKGSNDYLKTIKQPTLIVNGK